MSETLAVDLGSGPEPANPFRADRVIGARSEQLLVVQVGRAAGQWRGGQRANWSRELTCKTQNGR